MRFGSVCSGIEAASAAWKSLGWEAAWFSEIEPFPCAVLKHHYPEVPNLGDMTTLPARILAGEVEAPDILVGGTPCQSFSVAGLRQGLKDPRGQLTRTFVEICDAIDAVRAAAGKPPVVLVWENVPGVLSDRDNAFGNFLGALSGEDGALEPPGGKWTNAGLVCGPARDLAWRVLDAQYFGVAQRRRRVFLVGHSCAGSLRPVKVLLVEPGVRRDSPPSREARQGTPTTPGGGPAAGGGGLGAGHDGGRGVVSLQDVRGMTKAQNGRGWSDDGTSYTVDTHATQGVAHVVGRGGVAYGFNFEQFSGTEGPISPCLTKTEHKGKTLIYDGPHVVAPPLTATNDPSRSPQSAEVTAQVSAVVHATAKAMVGQLVGDRHDPGVSVQEEVHPPLCANPMSDWAPFVRTMEAQAFNGYQRMVQSVASPLMAEDYKKVEIGVLVPSGRWDAPPPVARHPVAASHWDGDYAHPTLNQAHNTGGIGQSNQELFSQRGGGLVGAMAVRRLTPVECERLQGFPDDYTLIPWKRKPASECPDGPRYKALGNSMAVPVMRWIGRQIQRAR